MGSVSFAVGRSGSAGGWRIKVTERNATPGQIVWRKFQCYPITLQDTNVVFTHLAAAISDYLMLIFQNDDVLAIRQDLGNNALHFNQFFFSHLVSHSTNRGIRPETGEIQVARESWGKGDAVRRNGSDEPTTLNERRGRSIRLSAPDSKQKAAI